MGKYNFQNHPFKDDMLKMFEAGDNPYGVLKFLQSKGEEYLLSKITLYKHYKYYKNAHKEKPKGAKEVEAESFKGQLEEQLWETIKQCNTAMKGDHLSPKDWQYYDQQKQSAIEKLIKLKDFKGSTDDASIMLSKFFQKFTIDKALADSDDKPKIKVTDEKAQADDNEPGSSSDLLPGEPV